MTSHRILYAGDDITLPARLRDELRGPDYFVVRSPVGMARLFIQSEIEYSLFLFDETEAGAELEAYARSLPHRELTFVLFVKSQGDIGGLLDAIKRRLR